jgi:transposase
VVGWEQDLVGIVARWSVAGLWRKTLEAGASVARVALKYGVNANQVFQWRRLYRDGKLGVPPESAMKLLPVSVADDEELPKPGPTEVASSRIGRDLYRAASEVRISLEGGVDSAVVRAVLVSLRA